MMRFARRLRRDSTGATAVEYGLIAALIAVALITALAFMGDRLGSLFNEVGSTLDCSSDPAVKDKKLCAPD